MERVAGFELDLADGVAAEAPPGAAGRRRASGGIGGHRGAFGASANVARGIFDRGGDLYAGANAGLPPSPVASDFDHVRLVAE